MLALGTKEGVLDLNMANCRPAKLRTMWQPEVYWTGACSQPPTPMIQEEV